jgi:putative ABC transport system permease protein
MAKDHPEDEDLGARLVPLKTALTGFLRGGLLIAFVVVGFIFLIACANVATLLLSRAATRRREIAVRLALGATRKRLLAQFLVEGLLLAFLAAALALATSHWTVAALLAAGHNYFSLAGSVPIDSHVAGFTAGIAAIAALLISLVVGCSSTRLVLGEVLKESSTNLAGSRSRMRMQRLLVAVQVSCCFLLLVGTGTLVESFVRLSRMSLGFDPHHVLAMRLPFSRKYAGQHPLSSLLEPVLARIDALPGVRAAGVITYLPMEGAGTTSNFRFSNGAVSPHDQQWAEVRAVSSDYYSTLGIRLVRGRLITASDSKGSPLVALVNEAFVRRYSPELDVIGRRISMIDEPHWATIVGVVDDVHQASRNEPSLPEVDLPYSQSTWPYLTATMTLAVRTEGNPLACVKAVQQAIESVDSSQPAYNVTTMEQIVADAEGDRRFALSLLSAFSLLAIVLAAVGLFAQLSYAVSERSHEIGVRIALGARYRHILEMVGRQGAVLAGTGIALGWISSILLLKVIRALLFGINPAFPTVGAGATTVLLFIVAVAGYLPARRAAKIDTMVALRRE